MEGLLSSKYLGNGLQLLDSTFVSGSQLLPYSFLAYLLGWFFYQFFL
jgi:hypothetical protein